MRRHACSLCIERGYEVVELPDRWNGGTVLSLYDKRTHEYLLRLAFCPFCGEKL